MGDLYPTCSGFGAVGRFDPSARLLTVTVPKTAKAQRKQITVQSGA